jgi:hypothetical protein
VSFVFVAPQSVAAAAGKLAGFGSAISAANVAAAAPTTQVPAAAADAVSSQVAAVFGGHGLQYQAISAQLAAFQEQFVQSMNAGAASYATAEAINVERALLGVINAPTQTLLAGPLIGGTNVITPGDAGGAGGVLYGNGGNGAAGAAGQPGGPGSPARTWGNGEAGGPGGANGEAGGAGGANGGAGGGLLGLGGPGGTGGIGGAGPSSTKTACIATDRRNLLRDTTPEVTKKQGRIELVLRRVPA